MVKRFKAEQHVRYTGPERSMHGKVGTVAAPTSGRTTLVKWPDTERAVYTRFLELATL